MAKCIETAQCGSIMCWSVGKNESLKKSMVIHGGLLISADGCDAKEHLSVRKTYTQFYHHTHTCESIPPKSVKAFQEGEPE